MRARAVLLAAALAGAGLTGGPASAQLPSVCNVVATSTDTRALVAYDAPGTAARAVTAAGGRVVGGIAGLGVLQASFGTRAARDAAVRALAHAPGVRAVQAERTYAAHRTPNDTYLRYQWGLEAVRARAAWDVEPGTRNPVTVAVLDTGVDLDHPDLAGRVLPGPDLVDNDDDPTDTHGHGTHVAGVIGARTNNRRGIAGLSWGAKVLAVRVLGSDGTGSDCDIALGMVQSADAGAGVLNMSLGTDGARCGTITQAAVDYVREAGAVLIASSGNAAKGGNPESTPANCAGVLAVGATDHRDKVAPFSTHHPYVDVSAPGVGIWSTYWDPEEGVGTYAGLSGTSMAAPHVAGIAALLLAKNPTWTPDQVEARIVGTSDDRGPRGKDAWYGAGRVNAARALR